MIEVRVFATLRQGRDKISMLPAEQFENAGDILRHLDIPAEEVAILLINGFHKKPGDQVKDGDVVALFPLLEAAEMDERYVRNLGALTEEECEALAKKKVCVAGCGGLGGHLTELLARVGVGSIVAADGDVFEYSNFNRQLLSGQSTLGINKARAAGNRVTDINPNIAVTAVEEFLNEKNTPGIIAGCDAVLDGLDSIPARKMLSRACAETGVPLIYGAIRGWVAQAAISMPGDGLIDRLYPTETALKDKSVLSFTPALCASIQVSLCVRLLLGRPVETGVLHYADLLHGEYETILF